MNRRERRLTQKNRRSKKPRPATPADPDAGESRGAVALTVAWMLLALSTLAAQVVALAVWLFARTAGVPGRPNYLMLVPTTLMMVALFTGILVLVLTPLTYRVRRAPPPLSITIGAIVVALLPPTIVALAAMIAP
jgi:hypothetical protein